MKQRRWVFALAEGEPMSRRLRIQDESFFYFITNRCAQEQFLLAPNEKSDINALSINDLIKECLKNALNKRNEKKNGKELSFEEKFKIYGAVFMSNHFHLIVKAPRLGLSKFMSHFQSTLARGVNKIRGRRGSVFPERFKSEIIVDDLALLRSMRYLLLNPVKAGLVEHPSQWPGFITCSSFMDDPNGFQVTPLPMFKGGLAEQQHLCQALIEGVAKETVKGFGKKGVRGAYWVKKQSWRGRPRNPKFEKRSFFDSIFCGCAEKKKNVYDALCQAIGSYRAASLGFGKGVQKRAKRQKHKFPVGMHLPVVVMCWNC